MRSVAAFLIETIPSLGNDVNAIYSDVNSVINNWLEQKGVEDYSSDHERFTPSHGDGEGTVKQEILAHNDLSLRKILLVEPTGESRKFITEINVIKSNSFVKIHITLFVLAVDIEFSKNSINPKCPMFIRDLFALDCKWSVNGHTSPNGGIWYVRDNNDSAELCRQICDPNRAFPILAISERAGNIEINHFDTTIANQLISTAHVVRISDTAFPFITDNLGAPNACTNGDIKLYWPSRSPHELSHYQWSHERILKIASGHRPKDRLCNFIRRHIFDSASLSLPRPREISQIKNAISKEQKLGLLRQLEMADDHKQLAILWEEECRTLKEDNDLRQEKIEKLEEEVRFYKEYYGIQRAQHSPSTIDNLDTDPDVDVKQDRPRGVRFYKKLSGATGQADKMVERGECNHNNWARGDGDKALKGVELLTGYKDWKSIKKCASCTGGGLWRVDWGE